MIFFLTVIGFNVTRYRLDERVNPHQLTIRVLSHPQSLVRDVGIELFAMDVTAISMLLIIIYMMSSYSKNYQYIIGGSDYSVVTGPASLKTLNSTNQQTTYAVTIINDGIVLEKEETFNLWLQQTSGQQPVVAFQNTTITIVDRDGQTKTFIK